MRTVIFPIMLGAASLAGCASPAQQAAVMEREMDRMIVVYGPACERLGFSKNTDAWRNCVLNLSNKDDFEQYYAYPNYRPSWRY